MDRTVYRLEPKLEPEMLPCLSTELELLGIGQNQVGLGFGKRAHLAALLDTNNIMKNLRSRDCVLGTEPIDKSVYIRSLFLYSPLTCCIIRIPRFMPRIQQCYGQLCKSRKSQMSRLLVSNDSIQHQNKLTWSPQVARGLKDIFQFFAEV